MLPPLPARGPPIHPLGQAGLSRLCVTHKRGRNGARARRPRWQTSSREQKAQQSLADQAGYLWGPGSQEEAKGRECCPVDPWLSPWALVGSSSSEGQAGAGGGFGASEL